SLAPNTNGIQSPLELTLRSENTGDSIKDAEVGIVEMVYTVERCVPRFARYPRSKVTLAQYLARRLRVCEFGIELHGNTDADRLQRHAMQCESKRRLVVLFWQDRDDGIPEKHFFNNDAGAAGTRRRVAPLRTFFSSVGCSKGRPLTLRWNVDFHSIEGD